ncbi:MAG: hypothetical protein HOM21_11720, partial [Halobacteriovoraceae bacterium]|nr:hypothetical protein [Halobacteriovoraceae bacterium]
MRKQIKQFFILCAVLAGMAGISSANADSKHKRHYKHCKSPKHGQLITWNAKHNHWHSKYYACGDHNPGAGTHHGQKLEWQAYSESWVEPNNDEYVDTNLVVNGYVQSLTGGFIFPDGTVQTTAATGNGSGGSGEAGPQGPAG